jgi:hypothetical protein
MIIKVQRKTGTKKYGPLVRNETATKDCLSSLLEDGFETYSPTPPPIKQWHRLIFLKALPQYGDILDDRYHDTRVNLHFIRELRAACVNRFTLFRKRQWFSCHISTCFFLHWPDSAQCDYYQSPFNSIPKMGRPYYFECCPPARKNSCNEQVVNVTLYVWKRKEPRDDPSDRRKWVTEHQ